ncbi:MAG: hypothetical protein F6K22_04090 [Okeania sp. SIO2F4]|nr:hypothetical protein [Okeania sp. SIO2F4]NES02084.1 hypothetical protein [Okeania sp. SIO2F4]
MGLIQKNVLIEAIWNISQSASFWERSQELGVSPQKSGDGEIGPCLYVG